MLFNSFPFLLFAPTVFVVYWLLQRGPLRAQNLYLAFSAYVFYGWWDYRFLSLLAASTVIDWAIGLRLGREENDRRRRGLLGLSLGFNLGVLAVFKYYGFFVDSAESLLRGLGMHPNLPLLKVILPVGISFYTFQSLSYVFDVYRRQLPAVREFSTYVAFVSFFPQMMAGPIERARYFVPQFQQRRTWDEVAAADGLRQILWGFFKKVVVADTLAPQVDSIFHGHATADGLTLAVGAVLFGIQIYGDFSGYSDIAIGLGRLFGFNLMRNFAYPYFSRSIGEFWRRWHISLSTWFRDYLYIPLGGNRVGPVRRALNVLIVFLLSGLWHGANWTYLVWGGLHGLYYLPRAMAGGKFDPADIAKGHPKHVLLMLVTFVQVTIAWVFFRAASVAEAWAYLSRMVTTGGSLSSLAPYGLASMVSAALLAAEWFQRTRPHALDVAHLPTWARWSAYYAVLAALFATWLTRGGGNATFIYFQF